MRLKGKLILIFLFLSIVPLVISSVFVVSTVNHEVAENIEKLHVGQIRLVGERLDWVYRQTSQSVREVVRSFKVQSLTDDERQGLLRLLYRQNESINGVALVNGSAELLTAPVYFGPDRAPLSGHVSLSHGAMEKLVDPKLISRANVSGVAWGQPVQFDTSPVLHMPLAVAASKPLRADGPVVLAYITVYELLSHMGPFSSEYDRELRLAQSDGHLLATAKHGTVKLSNDGVTGLPKALSQVILRKEEQGTDDAGESSARSGNVRYEDASSEDLVLAAYYEFRAFDLVLLSITPTDQAYGAMGRIKQETMYWIGVAVIIALIFTSFFARTLVGPIGELAEAVLAIAGGNYQQYVEVQTKDEVGDLATSFNYMAQELQSQKTQIKRQSDEIQQWNEELQGRVERRTAQLKETQDYLIHTQKLAAVAEISSGVAHELNNPLAVVLGFVQILSAKHSDDDDGPLLQQVEEHAQRCREIVQHLLSFAEAQVDQGGYDRLNFADVIRTVFKLFDAYFQKRHIDLRDELPANLMVFGNRAQLLQATLQLITATRANIPEDGVFELTAEEEGDFVIVRFVGSKEGVVGEKLQEQMSEMNQTEQRDQAMSQGLSLWLAQKIVTDHDGRLVVSRAESGTASSLRLHRERFERTDVLEDSA